MNKAKTQNSAVTISSRPVERIPLMILAGLLLLAGALRCFGLDQVPAGLFRDEAEKGYNAWALAHEGGVVEFSRAGDGRAIIGWNAYPFVVDVMGVKTSAIYHYASTPFVRVLGLSVGSARLAAATAGALTIGLLGLLLLRLWPPLPALTATLWLTLCPWHLVFSRWALQGIFIPLGMIGVLTGAAAAEKDRPWSFPLAGASLGFMFYAYSGAQPFVLVWGIALTVIYGKAITKRPAGFGLGLLFLVALAAPRVWIILVDEGGARLDAVAIWNEEGATAVSVLSRFVTNYISHFDPRFLFLDGDALARHSIPGLGQLLLIDVILLPLGIWATVRKRFPLRYALLAAFLLGPIGAAITRTGIPHALRAIPMVLPAAIWGGVGLAELVRWIARVVENTSMSDPARQARTRQRGRILAGVLFGVAVLFALRIYGIYWKTASDNEEVRRAFAASERAAFETVRKDRNQGEELWISGAVLYAPYFALFYNELPARETALGSLEDQGIRIFPPIPQALHQIEEIGRPGDWVITFDPVGEEARAIQLPR